MHLLIITGIFFNNNEYLISCSCNGLTFLCLDVICLKTASRNTLCNLCPKKKRCKVIDSSIFEGELCSCSYNGTLGILNIDPKINCHLCVLSFFHIDWSFHMYCCRFLTNMTKFGISLSLYVLMNPVFVKRCSQKYWKILLSNSSCIYLIEFCRLLYII